MTVLLLSEDVSIHRELASEKTLNKKLTCWFSPIHFVHSFCGSTYPRRWLKLTPYMGQVEPFDIVFFKGHDDFQCGGRKLYIGEKYFPRIKFKGKVLISLIVLVISILTCKMQKVSQLTPPSPIVFLKCRIQVGSKSTAS